MLTPGVLTPGVLTSWQLTSEELTSDEVVTSQVLTLVALTPGVSTSHGEMSYLPWTMMGLLSGYLGSNPPP